MINGKPIGIGQYQPIIQTPVTARQTTTGTSSGGQFNEYLQSLLEDSKIKFSGHAKDRITNRNVELDPAKMERLNEAVERARTKGARETLVLLDDVAMVVSIKNNTVITVMTGDTLKENVFTNIDSAVLA